MTRVELNGARIWIKLKMMCSRRIRWLYQGKSWRAEDPPQVLSSAHKTSSRTKFATSSPAQPRRTSKLEVITLPWLCKPSNPRISPTRLPISSTMKWTSSIPETMWQIHQQNLLPTWHRASDLLHILHTSARPPRATLSPPPALLETSAKKTSSRKSGKPNTDLLSWMVAIWQNHFSQRTQVALSSFLSRITM